MLAPTDRQHPPTLAVVGGASFPGYGRCTWLLLTTSGEHPSLLQFPNRKGPTPRGWSRVSLEYGDALELQIW